MGILPWKAKIKKGCQKKKNRNINHHIQRQKTVIDNIFKLTRKTMIIRNLTFVTKQGNLGQSDSKFAKNVDI